MDQTTVNKILNDLPAAFKRLSDTTWQQFMDSLTAALYRLANGADGITQQLTYSDAVNGWLDLWGMMLGIPRRSNEADLTYIARITVTVTGGAGPDQCILSWIFIAWGVIASLVDNAPSAVGYQIGFPAIVNSIQINQIILGLAAVRPAGVPFTVVVANVGTYLDTINYLNAGQVTGAYLGGGTTPVTITMGAATNNSPPLVPTLFLTDPTLNP